MKNIRALLFYLLRGSSVNEFYNLTLEEGICQDETFNWLQRTLYYMDFLEYYGE